MNNSLRNRIAAGVSVGAFALAAASMGAPAANAASAMTYWEEGNSRFEMTVSNSTPATGDTITISNTFQRKWADEYIYSVKYLVPNCLEYVWNSAKWDTGVVQNVEDLSGQEASFVKANANSVTSWKVTGLGAGFGDKQKVSMQFVVGDNCPIGKELGTDMHYGGSLGDGTYHNKGPKITVSKGAGGGLGGIIGGGGSGSLDTGSLGGGFGS